jgi:hypothetical protein
LKVVAAAGLAKRLFSGEVGLFTGQMHVITLFLNGVKTPVSVTDQVPFFDSSQNWLESPSIRVKEKSTEVWPFLVEKAWAKVHKSYAKMLASDLKVEQICEALIGVPVFPIESTDELQYYTDKGYHIQNTSSERIAFKPDLKPSLTYNTHSASRLYFSLQLPESYELSDLQAELLIQVNPQTPATDFSFALVNTSTL